jgi:hypothetical protein
MFKELKQFGWGKIAVITILAIGLLVYVVCVTRIDQSVSYAQLQSDSTASRRGDVGRAWCAKESKHHGSSSTAFTLFGVTFGLLAFCAAAGSTIFPNSDEMASSKWDAVKRHRGFLLMSGSALLATLSYAMFDRSNRHAEAASQMQRAIALKEDVQAHADCVNAVADVYDTRQQTNALVSTQLLKHQEAQQKIQERAQVSQAASEEILAAHQSLSMAQRESQVLGSSKNSPQSDANANRLSLLSVRVELAQAKLKLATVPDSASEEVKGAAKSLVDQLELKAIRAQAVAAGISVPAPTKPGASATNTAGDAGISGGP